MSQLTFMDALDFEREEPTMAEIEAEEVEEPEVILGDNEDGTVRTIRVYDDKGDFTVVVPEDAKVTFGYFNPAASGKFEQAPFSGHGGTTMKTTALRIYEKGERGNQLACFMGVRGFRDERIKLTRLVERVVIERNLSDDGEGYQEFSGSSKRQLVASPEPDTYG